MKKILSLILALSLLTACSSSSQSVSWSKTSFYKVMLAGEEFYFRYPEEASLNEYDAGLKIFYQDCKVFAGTAVDLFGSKQLIAVQKQEDDLSYTAWYKGDEMLAYDIVVVSKNYLFRVGDGSESIEHCKELVDEIAESFTSQLGYFNESYGYSLQLPSDFDAEYFADDEGVVLRKWVQVELSAEDIEDGKDAQYKVEMVVAPFENVDKYKEISAFIGAQYPGYSIEFADYGEYNGFFVDEGAGEDAVRHFFSLSEDASNIFEAYLKLPANHYNEHKESFDELVSSMNFS